MTVNPLPLLLLRLGGQFPLPFGSGLAPVIGFDQQNTVEVTLPPPLSKATSNDVQLASTSVPLEACAGEGF